MGFNFTALLTFVFGLLLPVIIFISFLFSKRKKEIAFESIIYGFLSFMGSIVAVFIGFMLVNSLFLSSLKFDDVNSGMIISGTIIIIMLAILFFACESLKIMTIRNFQNRETNFRMSGIGFTAGVIIAQNVCIYIMLNIMKGYELDAAYALYSGGIVCITGIMYLVLSASCQVILKDYKNFAPAYALSSIYYLYWVFAIIVSKSTILLYLVSATFFIASFILSGVFIFKKRKKINIVGELFDN